MADAYFSIFMGTGIQCTSGWSAPATWQASHVYDTYDGVAPISSNGHHYLVYGDYDGGTSGSNNPFSADDENWDVIYDGSVSWTCFDEFTNPQNVTTEPFGHGMTGGLLYLAHCGTCNNNLAIYTNSSYYNSGSSTYDLTNISSQHEVAYAYHRLYAGTELVAGHTYRVKLYWKKGSEIIWYDYWDFIHESSNSYYNGDAYIGWTPCWWWKYGSEYAGYEEIIDNGTDYSHVLELYEGASLICESTKNITISNLDHTVLYWDHIQDYTGAEVGGDFGMKASKYVHDLGTDTWITAWYRQKNLDYNASIKVDGFDGTVNLQAYRSGHVKQTRSCTGLVDKNLGNGPYDFTGADYLQATVEGIVHNADAQLLPNVNVWGSRWPHYGAKTMSNGKYALPCHIGGTYQIRASKNNHIDETQPTTVVQTGNHPSARALRDFTGAYAIERRTDYPQGEYAHVDSLAVDNQSVIIPDDPVTGAGTLLHPDSIGASIVKAKTRKWGTGAAQSTTSTGTSNGGKGHGSGGLDYDGNMGDAEYWSEEP